jgi:hydrogenase maturation protease
MEYDRILILDAIGIEDEPGSIYHIPSSELSGIGINSGGAHEIGVMQCLDMLELLGKPLPQSSVLGIVPHTVKVHIGLTPQLQKQFSVYIETIIKILESEEFAAVKNSEEIPLEMIVEEFKNPRR